MKELSLLCCSLDYPLKDVDPAALNQYWRIAAIDESAW